MSSEEKALGHQIKELIDQGDAFQGYIAQNQSSLEDLTRNIFSRLMNCCGLICVMHERGHVSSEDGNTVRASVWIEQEIAIAAFLTQVLDKNIKIQLYSKKGIRLEGVREKLQIIPTVFATDDEVLTHLRRLLETWSKEVIGHEEKDEREGLEKLLDELQDNRQLLSLNLSNFQPVEEVTFRDLKRSGALDRLAPGLKESIKKTYQVIANYSSCLQRVQNIQSYAAHADAITIVLSPAKL